MGTYLSNFTKGICLLVLLLASAPPGFAQAPPTTLPEPPALPDSTALPAPGPSSPASPLTPAMSDQPPPADFLTPPTEPTVVRVEPVDNLTPPKSDLPKWHFHLLLETSLTYDDNIFIQPNQKQADFYFGITPIVALGWGTFQADPTTVTGEASRFPQIAARDFNGNSFLLRYAPTAVLFLHHSDQDALNEDVMLGGRYVTGKLTVDLSGRFQTLSAPDIDVGNRINSEVTSGLFNANYQMTEKTSLDSRFALEHDSYQGGLDSTDMEISSLLNYQVLPKTMVGIGGGIGYTTVQSGQDQYYEQGLLHARWEPTAKLTFEGTAGVEVREITSGPTHTTPVFEFNADYLLQDSTRLRLSLSRRTETSALYLDQDIERTTVEASLRQRLFQKVYVTLNGGYQHIDYIDAGATANRTDHFTYFGVESAWEVTKWLSVRASYRHQDDDSSNGDFSFRRNLADVQCNIQF